MNSPNEPGQPMISSATITSFNVQTPRVALAVGAHPDDVEFGCGGTLAKWAAEGCLIHHVVLTDGSKGTWNPDADIEQLVITRQVEQRAAAKALGARGEVVFLHQVDGELESKRELCSAVAFEIRRLKPDVVLGHDPWRRYRLHPDHRNAGFLVCDAIVAARDPHFFREHGIAHHRPDRLLLWEADAPDHAEDISQSLDVKLSALLEHHSQFESTMKAVDEESIARFRSRIRERATNLGAQSGLPAAEFFKLIADL